MSWCEQDDGRDLATRCALWRARLPFRPGAETVPHPAAGALCAAITTVPCSRPALGNALAVYAWEGLARGRELDQTLADISALWELLVESDGDEGRHVPIGADEARSLVLDAWIDAAAADRDAPGVVPISGLHTVSYLVGRVHELDRQTRLGTCPLVLIVTRWPEPADPWERISTLYAVDAAMRATIRVTATLAQAGATMTLALVSDDARSRLERRALDDALDDRFWVDLAPVPDDRSQLARVVGRWRDGNRPGDGRTVPGQRDSDQD